MELVPITPGEPIVPEPIEVEITPGRPPGERALEIEPGRSWDVTDAAPPLPEPERVSASSGWGGGEPPKRLQRLKKHLVAGAQRAAADRF